MYNNIADYRTSMYTLLRFKISSALDLCAKVIILVSVASINELAFMITGLDRVGTVLLIIPAGFLLLYYWPYAIANRLILKLVGPILVYVLIAITYGMLSGNVDFSLARTYFASSVLMTGIAIHTIKSSKESVVNFSRGVLLLVSVSIILSHYYYPYLKELPPSFTGNQRISGFFLNPNEAGLSSVFFLNFILYRPYKKRIFNFIAIALALVNIAITLSKTCLILLFASLILFFLLTHKWMPFVFMILSVPLLLLSLQSFVNTFEESDFELPLADDAIRRLHSMHVLLGGKIDDNATSYRISMWSRSVPVIVDHFPHGTGLGTFYHIEAPFYQKGIWQGIHNMYLMIVGEAGFVVFALFIVCYGHLFALALSSKDKLPFGILLNALLFFVTSHNGFTIRFLVVLLAIATGLLSMKSERVSHPISS